MSEITPPIINRNAHLESIEAAIAELMTLEEQTLAPAPLAHQYIGTVIDNTICLLAAPANALDNGARRFTFSEDQNWLSLMKAVHRSSIHLATERALHWVCKENSIQVEGSLKKQGLTHLCKLQTYCTDINAQRSLENLRKIFESSRPNFDDYLSQVLRFSHFNVNEKKHWRRFFKALTIVRNKVSHSDTSLTVTERTTLEEGGFEVLISTNGVLVMNPRMYIQVARYLLEFFTGIKKCRD